jgi:mono/diheme cytochrome c family protein
MLAALTLVLAFAPEPAETPADAPAAPKDANADAAGAAGPTSPPAPTASAAADPALQAAVKKIFDDACTMCHGKGGDPSDPGALDLESPLTGLIGRKSVVTDQVLVVPGNPDASYLLVKMLGTAGMKGELMPLGMGALEPAQIDAVRNWIAALPPQPAATPSGGDVPTPPRRSPKPFHGTDQIVLPTTTTLGKRTLQYRIDHRFGRIGTERGAFGLDAGVVMSMGMQYGIIDGWDVRLRRGNSRKAWELGTKYVPVRQEDGMPVSFGMWGSVDFFRDFDVGNPWSGNFVAMLSRLWFDRWATMLTVGYHLRTNHNPRPTVDFDDGEGPVLVDDTRDTLALGLATSVYLGKRKQWGIDLEWLLPIPDGGTPNKFYYRGGDTDPSGSKIGAWGIGGSYTTGKHFFQVFFTNNREIHTNLAAPGGQSGNPFGAQTDSKNPFLKADFFLGFNLGRNFTMGKRLDAARERKGTTKAAKPKRNAAAKGGA